MTKIISPNETIGVENLNSGSYLLEINLKDDTKRIKIITID